MTKIVIPYSPRYPQDEIHTILESNRFSVLVAHRRMGKTVCVLNHLIKQALLCNKQDGMFGYVAPLYKQAKSIAWLYLKRFTAPFAEYGRTVNESELFITLPSNNGNARIRLFGADNPDSLRGLYFDGIVLDEVAQMKTELWGEIIRPTLADRNGFAVFIGTPKGINLFSELYYRALAGKDGWRGALYRADETGVLSDSELAAMKEEIGDNAYRREMLCDFSASADDVLISIDLAHASTRREVNPSDIAHAGIVLGVDVARFGDDKSVIFPRQGLLASEPVVLHGLNNMEVANCVAVEINRHKPASIFIDAGRGEGVIDRLRELGFANIIEVNFGGKAGDIRYVNKRTEMWAEMAEWLKAGGKIPDSLILKSELTTPTYSFNGSGQMVLEEKKKIKERLGKSPDIADALALTFAWPVPAAPVASHLRPEWEQPPQYDPWTSLDCEVPR